MKAWECGRNLLTFMITLEDICLRMQTVIDRTVLPNILNTQILNPFKNTDPAVKMAFPGVNVNDKEQANVRPPNPSLCVGNGFIIATTDLVRPQPAPLSSCICFVWPRRECMHAA